MYQHLTKNDNGPSYIIIWKFRIPMKKLNLYVIDGLKTILTKDNMIKRKWKGDKECYFCGLTETVGHQMFERPMAKVVRGI
jgi:hypothetical protein